MQFVQDGPNVPPDLVTAQEKGQTIFVCGAGVSRPVGLPLFRGLVEGVYRELGEDWNLHVAEREGMTPGGALDGQYDRVLRCLERRLAASDLPRNRGMRERIRAAVRHVLRPPDDGDLGNHLALLELSRDEEGRSRLLTTNFDTLFERAWFERHGVPIASHAGTAMPQPKVAGCTGVLHLHGRLADDLVALNLTETDLVLTSAEFGDAYLRSGWASRYVYDLVRAYVVVLVGYQADDPPMRYLLEALEADRERYPDLQKVFAFASCAPGEEEVTRALWLAKGVEPILYTVDGDHSPLYRTLSEWRRYADDPTAWRRDRLRVLLAEKPDALAESALQECIDLLGHGDASQLLGELSPAAEWMPVLSGKRVFKNETHAGLWASARINDPDMIRQCAALGPFDDQTRWFLQRALDDGKTELTPVRREAWNLILATARPERMDFDDGWYRNAKRIKQGKTGHQARKLVTRILRPRFVVKKRFSWREEDAAASEPEALRDLIDIEFEPARHPTAEEMLSAWPALVDEEVRLFRMLERAFTEALEEADEVGFLTGLDRADYDVPSVAPHRQNAHHSGFYPITRALADLWTRIAERDPAGARSLAGLWAGPPHFNLTQRLYLYALAHPAYSADEVAARLRGLDDNTFWSGQAQVEIMHLLSQRWNAFAAPDRQALEARLRGGVPRALFPEDAFEKVEEWESILDSSIYRRLKRIEAAGGQLDEGSTILLGEISARHPKWEPSPGDRDDFSVWHESGFRGPDGEPGLLARVQDEALVREAMRIQREQRFEQGDIWRVFCAADPDRALRGLKLEAARGEWDADAWRSLIWAACDKGSEDFQFELAECLLRMPEGPLLELLSSATSWLQKRRGILAAAEREGGPRFLPLWDRFADLAYDHDAEGGAVREDDDLETASLNEPGGMLAWVILDALSEPKPKRASGLGVHLKPRFDRIVGSGNRAGLLGRVYLIRSLAYIDAIDPTWAMENLAPRLQWSHPESLAMWRSYSNGNIGSAALFNALKQALLAAFERRDLKDHDYEGLMAQLLSIGTWHQRGEAPEYALTHAEIRRALTVGPSSVRQNASWNLWRMVGDAEGEPADRAERWRTILGPLFRGVWPLDARLRSERTSNNLVLMAMECGAAFPDAVETILDLLVPYQLYTLAHSLRLEPQHENLVREHPLAFVRLVNALVDPAKYPVPNDLATLLQECAAADPTIVNDPAYVRLFGLRRGRGA
jgi:hypothetical protein